MKKKLLSVLLSASFVAIPLFDFTVFADTPADNANNPAYGTIEQQRNMPGISFTYKNGKKAGTSTVAPQYIVAVFECMNAYASVDSSLYVGYNYISSGFPVLLAQAALQAAGYNPGSLDGIFGPNTQQAVINFQRDNGLSVDATIGPNTWSLLGTRCQGKELPINVPGV